MKLHLLSLLKAAMVSIFLIGSLGGCATMEGMGKDVEDAGEAVQDAADG